MTRIFTEGAELGDVLWWTSGTNVVAGGYVGAYSVGAGGTFYKDLSSALTEGYARVRVKADIVNQNKYWINFMKGANNLLWISCNDIGRWTAVRGDGTTLATSSLPYCMRVSQWYLLEIYYKVDDANGRVTLKVDGDTIIDYTGDTKPGADADFDRIRFNGANQGSSYWDDFALNDTAGGVDDSWCGDGEIVKITPNGNGTTNDWHGSDGNDVDNYLLVDEYPADNDTTYVYNDTSAEQDQYALSDYVGTNKLITRIWVESRSRKTTAAADTLKLGYLPNGGVDQMSAAKALTTSYAWYKGDEALVNPVTAVAWVEADLDVLEAVVEVG